MLFPVAVGCWAAGRLGGCRVWASSKCKGKKRARLAQSVEHGTFNPRVVGSSPTSGGHSVLLPGSPAWAPGTRLTTANLTLPRVRYGLVARIPGSHPGGSGSIPGTGTPFPFLRHAPAHASPATDWWREPATGGAHAFAARHRRPRNTPTHDAAGCGGRPTARHTYLAQGLTVITKAVPSGRDGVIALRRC